MNLFSLLSRYAWVLALALGALYVSALPARAEMCGEAAPRAAGELALGSSLGLPVAVGTIRDRVLTLGGTPRYGLAEEGPVRLLVYDLLGREVAVLTDGLQKSGEHTVRFEASHLSSGLYFVVLDAVGKRFTKSVLLMK